MWKLVELRRDGAEGSAEAGWPGEPRAAHGFHRSCVANDGQTVAVPGPGLKMMSSCRVVETQV
jgi:hypothetical protein